MRIIFPHYSVTYRDKETRISEQELRFVFVEQFNMYCAEQNLNYYYSVETPTEFKYVFKDQSNPHKANEVENGQSAMIDLCIHDKSLNRVALIEFKALNPDEFCFQKDFCKLKEEKQSKNDQIITYFILLLKAANRRTIVSIKNKIKSKDEEAFFRCYNLEEDKDITEKILKE